MKRIIIIVAILLSASGLYAQGNNAFYKHELRFAAGDALLFSTMLEYESMHYNNLSLSYFFRPDKNVWVGANFVGYLGEKIYYDKREYYTDGSFKDFSKSKMKHLFILAPEFRVSYLNKESIIFYSSLAGGVGWENGYDSQWQKYPQRLYPCLNLTFFGLSCNMGKNNNIFIGGEFGLGFKGIGSIHGGYRF
jgi:hypothetical protein